MFKDKANFVGIEIYGSRVSCAACARNIYGSEVVKIIERMGEQGRMFRAIYERGDNYDNRECSNCGNTINGQARTHIRYHMKRKITDYLD